MPSPLGSPTAPVRVIHHLFDSFGLSCRSLGFVFILEGDIKKTKIQNSQCLRLSYGSFLYLLRLANLNLEKQRQ